MTNKIRNSNFELLRLILIFFIVSYHFFVYIFIEESNSCEVIYKAIWLPLHIAVICFVLISGYFHIRPSIRGVAKLFLPLIIYFTLPCIIADFTGQELLTGKRLDYIFFLSRSPYWYIRTYFYLFLISPILNTWLNNNNATDKRKMLIGLAFISVYEALMGDASVYNGKNIALFIFLYAIGDYLRSRQDTINKTNIGWLIIGWLTLNILLTSSWLYFRNGMIGDIIWRLSFPYSSPILIINAIGLFIIFSRLHFYSYTINFMAKSVFSVYILTEHILIKPLIEEPILKYLYHTFSTIPQIVMAIFGFALITLIICIFIDNIFQPFFKFVQSKI